LQIPTLYIMDFILIIPALVIALTIHEYAHAKVADLLGDPTPRLAGRLTFNPLAHLDPLGTLVLFLSRRFGWGKPVPIDPYNLQNPRRDQALISLAGPGANFVFVLLFALFLKIFPSFYSPVIIVYLAGINLSLGFFNLLPLGPLDGSKILLGIMPEDLAIEWEPILSQYGLIILILLFLPLANGASLLQITLGRVINTLLTLLF